VDTIKSFSTVTDCVTVPKILLVNTVIDGNTLTTYCSND